MHGQPSQVYELIIGSNEDVRRCIDEYIVARGWEHVYISGAIGSLCEVTFSAPVTATLPPEVALTQFVGAAEVTSFLGYTYKRSLAPPDELKLDPQNDSPLYVHIHISCGITGAYSLAGGFRGGKTLRAMNIYMIPIA